MQSLGRSDVMAILQNFLNLLIFLLVMAVTANAKERVVLLHGLARTEKSFSKMQAFLEQGGYVVSNIGYPSRKLPVEELARMVRERIEAEVLVGETVNFVTHSMGGILIRHIQKTNPLPNVGRVVMLAPPNQGSEVVDKLGGIFLFRWINGPAGNQLGTDPEGFVKQLGKVDFEAGVIAGDRSINLILSLLIPGKDDGKVSVESAKVEGMQDYRVVHSAHPFIMKNREVMGLALEFLRYGKFGAGR